MSRTFAVQLNEDSEHIPRAARRVIFNSDFLKAAKLCTGDIVALSSDDNSGILRKVGDEFPDYARPHDRT
jgi:AAA family ATPase